MKYGYARVSTHKQVKGTSLEDQRDQLIKAGAEKIIVDSYTGKSMERPELTKLLDEIKSGDTLIVTKMDRFARTAIEGCQTVRQLLDQGVKIHILNMGLLDNTPTGKLMVAMLLAFAEFERDMIVERTQTGKAIARESGKRVDGRPLKYTEDQRKHAMELLKTHSYTETAKLTGISKSTLVRLARKDKAENK